MKLWSILWAVVLVATGAYAADFIYVSDPPASGGGLFKVQASAIAALDVKSAPPMLDQNPRDGLSDVWVRKMAGGVIDSLGSDLDGDGLNFQLEHDLGLNPNISNSGFFRITINHSFTPSRLVLVLNDVQGVNYELDESYDLMGDWLYIPLSLNGNTNPGPYLILVPDSAAQTFWRIRPAGFQDSKDDLLNDFEEYLLDTRIDRNDSDGDGLLDGWEFINSSIGLPLDPAARDTNKNGLHDGIEVGLAGSTQTNGNNGVLIVVDTGWHHAFDPDMDFVHLGGQ